MFVDVVLVVAPGIGNINHIALARFLRSEAWTPFNACYYILNKFPNSFETFLFICYSSALSNFIFFLAFEYFNLVVQSKPS